MSAADQLVAAIKSAVAEVLREELPRALAAWRPPIAPTPRTLSINQLRDRYGIGRSVLRRMILDGQLPAVARRMRGGRDGWSVTVEDAERVLAGVKR